MVNGAASPVPVARPVTIAAMEPVLVCPGCRTRSEGRIDLRTLEPDANGGDGGDILTCACGRRYPIVDGIPIVFADPAQLARGDLIGVVERDLPTEIAELLVEAGPDDLPYARLLEHLSIYLDAHWGDRAAPPAGGPGAGLALHALADRIAARASARVGLAVELGCSVGRVVAELARGAERVVGLDASFASLRRARRLLDGERVAYHRRVIGRRYEAATATAGDRAIAADRRALVCGDALDPPLVPGVYERVVALNVLDAVTRPRGLLAVVDGLCAPGGEVILASPYAWQSGHVAEHERFGGLDPAAELVAILRDGRDLSARYEVEDEAELPWTLRRDARSAVTYRTHYVRARKL